MSETEWLSRELARAIRDDRIDPDETGRFLKVYGVEHPDDESGSEEGVDEGSSEIDDDSPPRLVEPMLVARTGQTIPEYDIRDVDETLVVRVTESEFEA